MKRLKYPVLILSSFLAFITSACTDLKLFAVNAPVTIKAENIKTDLVFDSVNNIALDLYFPENANSDTPLIVFIYGGSWQDGKKESYKFVAGSLVERGYAVAIPDYRKYPSVTFPDFVKDNANAIKWLHDNDEQYSYNASNIILMGHSAGAFNGAMLAYKNEYLKQAGVPQKSIKAFIGLSGPYAFTPRAKDIKAVFNSPQYDQAIQIPDFVEAGAPPALLMHGEKDTIVGKFNSQKLSKALKNKNVPVTVHYYDELNHAGTIAEFSWIKKEESQLLKDLDEFLKF